MLVKVTGKRLVTIAYAHKLALELFQVGALGMVELLESGSSIAEPVVATDLLQEIKTPVT